MPDFESTAWDVIDAAAAGDQSARASFVEHYRPGIRKLLQARWINAADRENLDDAVQDVLVECLKTGGVLDKAEQRPTTDFRSFLKTVVRHVAGRYEYRRNRTRALHSDRTLNEGEHAAQPSTASRKLDRDWARELLRATAAEQARRAQQLGAAARLRVDILRLRFEAGKSMRDIAKVLELDPAYVHHQFAKAKQDFHRALLRVLKTRRPGADDVELERECRELIGLLA
jgi:RNA polymerase sigma-70 factor (ECF subfamily)